MGTFWERIMSNRKEKVDSPQNEKERADQALKNLLLEKIRDTIRTWDQEGIYAVSLWVNDENDNPCTPSITLGYNTEAHYESQIDRASSAGEARWNYAFWLQNEELYFGGESSAEIKEWVLANGFPYYTEHELFYEIDPDEEEDEAIHAITGAFVRILIQVVQELHASGFVREKFGKDLPVLIHELEYYDEILDQNIRANGFLPVHEFVSFWDGEWSDDQ